MGRQTENALSQCLFERVVSDQVVRLWLWDRLDVPLSSPIAPVSKASQWRHSKEQRRWWETDIFFFLNSSDGHGRRAIHIENKIDASFTPDQSANYSRRAKEWSTRLGEEYEIWTTVLVAPAHYIASHKEDADLYDAIITHEELAELVPEFGKNFEHNNPEKGFSGDLRGEKSMKVAVDSIWRVFFAGAWSTETRIRTQPIGTRGGPMVREFTFANFEIEEGNRDGHSGYWVTLPESELVNRGIMEAETGPWHRVE